MFGLNRYWYRGWRMGSYCLDWPLCYWVALSRSLFIFGHLSIDRLLKQGLLEFFRAQTFDLMLSFLHLIYAFISILPPCWNWCFFSYIGLFPCISCFGRKIIEPWKVYVFLFHLSERHVPITWFIIRRIRTHILFWSLSNVQPLNAGLVAW